MRSAVLFTFAFMLMMAYHSLQCAAECHAPIKMQPAYIVQWWPDNQEGTWDEDFAFCDGSSKNDVTGQETIEVTGPRQDRCCGRRFVRPGEYHKLKPGESITLRCPDDRFPCYVSLKELRP